MGEWRECRLGDIGIVVGGGTPSRERAEYWDGAIPWLTPGEITGNSEKYVSETQDGISTLGLAASGAKLLPAGSLLITSRASIGSCALAGKPMATNQGFTNLTPGTDVEPSFLFHLGLTLGREMTRRASGTTFLEIPGREFGRIAVHLPPLEEQRRIAELLDTIDETIKATEHVIAKRRGVRAGLASDLLNGKLELARLRGCRSNDVLSLLASRDMSRSWRASGSTAPRRALGLDVDILQGFAFSSSGFSEEEGLPLVRIRDLTTGTAECCYSGSYADKYVIDQGDILIGMDGDFKVVRWSGTRALLNQRVCRVRPSTESLDDRFLFHAIQPEIDRIHRLTPQTTVRHLNTKGIRACSVLDVSPEEQRWIADVLDSIDEAIQVTERQLAKRRQLRAGLAADLLSGRVRTVAA